MITAINLSDLNYDYLEAYKLQQNEQQEETSTTKQEDTLKHEGLTQTTNSQTLNNNYDLVKSLISQYTTNSKSANIYNNLANTNNVFSRYNTKIQAYNQTTYKEKITKVGNELLDLQNQLSELVSSAVATTDNDYLEEYMNNYATLYNKLAEKKEEYNNLVKKSGMSETEISKQFGEKYSDEDETFGNLLSSQTSLQKIPTELVDAACNRITNLANIRVTTYQINRLTTGDEDADSDELDKLDDESWILGFEYTIYSAEFTKIAESNNFTQTNVFEGMFKPLNMEMKIEVSHYDKYIDDGSSMMSEIQTQLKTETDSGEKERLEYTYDIYELQLENLSVQKKELESEINSMQNIDIKDISTYSKDDLVERNKLETQIFSVNEKMQILAYQVTALLSSDIDYDEKINSLESQYQTYESELTELKKQLQKIEDKYNK